MWTEDTLSHTLNALQLGSLPAICMIIFTLIGLNKEVPTNIAGALQHFAAGILLCTIGTELLPVMVDAETTHENISMTVGFFLGVVVMISLGIFMPTEEDEDDDDEDAGVRISTSNRSKSNRLSLISAAKQYNKGGGAGTLILLNVEEIPENEGGGNVGLQETSTLLSTNKNTTTPTKRFPTTLLLAIAIDSAMDGLLIGIASVAGPSAGPMMSLSLTVEMSFLGLTLATALQGYGPKKTLPASFLGPVVLVLGAAIGGMLGSMVLDHHTLFTGLLSFGASALLYMVAEELLLEAHEDEGEDDQHVWWVDLQLYVGFWASVMLGKVVDMAST